MPRDEIRVPAGASASRLNPACPGALGFPLRRFVGVIMEVPLFLAPGTGGTSMITKLRACLGRLSGARA